ncbi:MAG: HEAT repeat domain-containing protein [Pseudomonadota bacterium]
MKFSHFALRTITLAFTLVLQPCLAAEPDAYQEGQQALRDRDFAAAVNHFRKAEEDGNRVDAALYWRAHALTRSGRQREAQGVARQLLRRFPESRWSDDAEALLAELSDPEKSLGDDDLEVYAILRLAESYPERAIPVILKRLEQGTSPENERHLLFVLATIDDERAAREVLRIAGSGGDPELQIQAIHMIGAGGADNLDSLAGLYKQGSDPRVRRAIIDAHLAADQPDGLARLIEMEQDPSLQRHAITALGAMGAVDELKQIYARLDRPESRRAVLEGLAISGDVSELAGVIEHETDPELRMTAIRSLGIAGDGGALLEELARGASTASEQRAILEALVIQDGSPETVIEVARRANEPEVLRQAIQTLAILDESDSLDALYAELGAQGPEVQFAMLEALVIMDSGEDVAFEIASTSPDEAVVSRALQTLGMLDAGHLLKSLYGSLKSPRLRHEALQQMALADEEEAVLEVLRTESNPELRIAAIQAAGMLDLSAGEALTTIYATGTPAEKRAVIETLMLQDDDTSLIAALETETDPDLKRRLIEALVAMDSDAADEYLFEWLER